MKTVEFNGKTFEVPDWASIITMDGFGNVEVWNHPPQRQGMQYVPVYASSSISQHVGHIKQMNRYQEIL